jgi:hypothetical protein
VFFSCPFFFLQADSSEATNSPEGNNPEGNNPKGKQSLGGSTNRISFVWYWYKF